MAIKATVLGCGGAGNKAAIALLERGIIGREYVHLLNTSPLDVPDQYKQDPNLFFLYSSVLLQGSGKEYSKGRLSIINAIKNGEIHPEDLLNDDSKEVIIVGSLYGGSGSSSTTVLAKYFDTMNIPIHVFAFNGFGDEIRGINNSLKFFKDLPDNVILHVINNSYFLDYTKNYIKAEQKANEEFVNEVEIMLGHKLVQSKQIIDETDLYKLNAQPGYMTINHINLNGIKNVEGFNTAIAKAFEDSCYMDSDQSVKRIGVMVNATKRVQEAIDNSFEVVKRYVGVPIETFQHIQPDEDRDLIGDEYIDILCCGLNFPEKSIKDINSTYNSLKDKMNTTRKSFDDIYADIDMEDGVDDFNMDIKRIHQAAKVDDLFADEIRLEATSDPAYRGPVIGKRLPPKQQQPQQEVVVPQNPMSVEKPAQKSRQVVNSAEIREEPIDIGELKTRQFINTKVNSEIYVPTYDVDEAEEEFVDESNQF